MKNPDVEYTFRGAWLVAVSCFRKNWRQGLTRIFFYLKAASPLCLLESSWCFKESIHENFHQACCGTAQCSQRLAPPRHPKEFREGHLSKRPIALLIVTLPCIFCRFCRSCCSCCFSALEQGLIRRTWKWLKENPSYICIYILYILKRKKQLNTCM